MEDSYSLENIKQNLKNISSDIHNCQNNEVRRKLYSKIELLRIVLEKNVKEGKYHVDEYKETINEMDSLIAKLSLLPHSNNKSILGQIDYGLRMFGFFLGFIPSGIIGSIIILVCSVFDSLIGTDSFQLKSEKFRRWLARSFLMVAGISIDVEGLNDNTFSSNCAILTFSHSCNLDGFFICATCPIRHAAFAKKELFMIPFFSWVALALGGVPVDRQNRDRAVKTLRRLAEQSRNSHMCFVIAPEGTRSLTGQLLQFKKGAFHLWEDLRTPIVPVVFFGGFDLWPVGTWINNTGHVTIRYLKPIQPSEAENRDDMMTLVRKRMLESLIEVPSSMAKPLSSTEIVTHLFVRLICVSIIIMAPYLIYLMVVEKYKMKMLNFLTFILVGSIIITIVLYTYFVYIANMFYFNTDRVDVSRSVSSEQLLQKKLD